MALVVWLCIGLAIWHFTIFLPERFWQGIIGALLGSTIGALLFGTLLQTALGRGMGETDVLTVLMALPGIAIGLTAAWALGVRSERASG